jgi:ABC-2 type transport system ATP-binding protein
MIAGVLLPDEGTVKVDGGVAPLIELTGGFLGELSARDNVMLTAGLHGLDKNEIEERFDAIIDFAGPQVRQGLDMPFRHFSSGMQVRLGFALITTLDEPVVLVDEVLAVGDKGFREKCYQRMEDLLAEGRSLFLVSHSEADLRRFCTRGLYLKSGRLVADGPMEDVLEEYNSSPS